MPTVSYRNQPAIHKTLGHFPLDGTTRPYTVNALLWPRDVEAWIGAHLLPPTLHICCGKSRLGDCRLDLYETEVDVIADAARLPFADLTWTTTLCDPPYNGKFQWNHDLLAELARVTRRRIIFQHWFLPIDRAGRFKKDHRFGLVHLAAWQPRTYFGRANLIAILDDAHP